MATPTKVPDDLFKPKSAGEIPDPFSASELKRTEKTLGVKLPAAFVSVLKARNGGSLLLSTFKMKRKPPARASWAPSCDYRIGSLAGIHPTDSRGITQLAETARGWGLPKGMIAIDGDGHYWVCLDYRACGPRGEPSITHWEQTDPSGPGLAFRIANSFAELLSGLRRAEDDYTPAAIALDRSRVRGKGLGSLLESLGARKHEYKGVLYSKRRLPPTWHWKKYRSFLIGQPVWLKVEKNRTYGYRPKFKQRPAGHPILCVSVRLKDEEKCLSELLAALGDGAELLQGVT